jgi:SEC-C motif
MRDEPKVGRNDPCPCGSGKKYKKCHGAQEGDQAIGVTANKPKVPKSDRGSAVANLETDSD